MFLASKYEETYAPECSDFVFICDKAYTQREVLEMEGKMLSVIGFQMHAPTALVFLRHFTQLLGIGLSSHRGYMAQYLVELTLPDYPMLQYRPSMVGAAALYLALRTLGDLEPWTEG